MESRNDLRALTLILGVIIALIILFSVWLINPAHPPVSIGNPLQEFSDTTLKQMGRVIIQSLF